MDRLIYEMIGDVWVTEKPTKDRITIKPMVYSNTSQCSVIEISSFRLPRCIEIKSKEAQVVFVAKLHQITVFTEELSATIENENVRLAKNVKIKSYSCFNNFLIIALVVFDEKNLFRASSFISPCLVLKGQALRFSVDANVTEGVLSFCNDLFDIDLTVVSSKNSELHYNWVERKRKEAAVYTVVFNGHSYHVQSCIFCCKRECSLKHYKQKHPFYKYGEDSKDDHISIRRKKEKPKSNRYVDRLVEPRETSVLKRKDEVIFRETINLETMCYDDEYKHAYEERFYKERNVHAINEFIDVDDEWKEIMKLWNDFYMSRSVEEREKTLNMLYSFVREVVERDIRIKRDCIVRHLFLFYTNSVIRQCEFVDLVVEYDLLYDKKATRSLAV